MLNSKQISPLQKKGFAYQSIATLCMVAILSSFTIFAFADVLSDQIVKLCNNLGTTLTTIFAPLCILILGAAIVTIVIGKNSKSAEQGMDWAKRAIIGFIIFNLLGTILKYGVGLFSGTGAWGSTSAGQVGAAGATKEAAAFIMNNFPFFF